MTVDRELRLLQEKLARVEAENALTIQELILSQKRVEVLQEEVSGLIDEKTELYDQKHLVEVEVSVLKTQLDLFMNPKEPEPEPEPTPPGKLSLRDWMDKYHRDENWHYSYDPGTMIPPASSGVDLKSLAGYSEADGLLTTDLWKKLYTVAPVIMPEKATPTTLQEQERIRDEYNSKRSRRRPR